MAQTFPHLFRDVGREGRQHYYQGLDRFTRGRNRTAPSIPVSDQRSSFSTGAANNTNRRVASAPKASIISSGSTPLPRLFDIALYSSVPSTRLVTMPCVSRRFTGSLNFTR